MELRAATRNDVDGMLAIYAPFIQNTAVSFEETVPSEADFWSRVEAVQQGGLPWLVAVEDATVAGYAYASDHRSRSSYRLTKEASVYVNEAFRGKGVARTLYSAIFEQLEAQGVQNVLAGMTEPNPASRGFHISMGFSLVGTYHNIGYKFGKWHDVSWYEKRLVAADAGQ